MTIKNPISYSNGVLLLAAFLILLETANTNINPAEVQLNNTLSALKCAEGSNQFTLKLYNALRYSRAGENMIFSGFSLRTVGAMLMAGAESVTATELQNGMLFPDTNSELFEGYRAMLRNGHFIKSEEKQKSNNPNYPATLEQANRIYIKKGFQLVNNFQTTAKYIFQSPISQIDFSNGKKAATEINNWVADRTNQRIQKLIDYDTLNTFTRVVVVNTLYFKSPWENKFNGRLTQKKRFYVNKERTTMVDMMHTEDYFSIVSLEKLNARAITLPYENKRFHLVILLPNQRFGLEEMERQLKDTQFLTLVEELTKSKSKFVLLSLPKFSIESTYDLIDTMKQLGVRSAFDENQADFNGILNKEYERLYVSKLVQKAFLTVEEEGSEAGSATYGAVFTPLSIGPTIQEEITIDHPFIGFIYDSNLQAVLFMFRKAKF